MVKLAMGLIKVAKYNNKIKVHIDNMEALLMVPGLLVAKLETLCNLLALREAEVIVVIILIPLSQHFLLLLYKSLVILKILNNY